MKSHTSSAGVHLFDRTSGWNLLIDEILPAEHSWSVAPRSVSVALTNACELKCEYCYASKAPAMLQAELVTKWAKELDQAGSLAIGFGGGEPTNFKGFAALCQAIARDTAMAVTFTTHGHNLTDELCRELKSSVHFVRLSMDGVGRTYEKLRGRSFADFCSQLRFARSIASFGLNVVVNEDTVDDLDEIMTFAIAQGAQELLLLPEMPVRGRPGIDSKTQDRMTCWIKRSHGRLRCSISSLAATDGIPLAGPFPERDPLESYAHVDAHGVLKATSFDSHGIFIGGGSIIDSLAELRRRDG